MNPMVRGQGCQRVQEARQGPRKVWQSAGLPICPSGECVVALKSMIGSTAQQFLTFLSHRGEETGNIRGSMKVRVPTERLGTRERLYGGGSTGKGVGHEMGWCGQVWEGRTWGGGMACQNPWNRVFRSSAAIVESGPALRSSWEGPGRSVNVWDPEPQVHSESLFLSFPRVDQH